MQRIETAIRTVLEFNEAFGRHDVEAMLRLMNDDCVFESPDPAPGGTVYAGKAAISKFWLAFFDQFPGVHSKVEDIFGFWEHCVLRSWVSWMDAAGTVCDVRRVDIFRVRGDSIYEHLSYTKG
jgi:ketosteroid isomerase-like protein